MVINTYLETLHIKNFDTQNAFGWSLPVIECKTNLSSTKNNDKFVP